MPTEAEAAATTPDPVRVEPAGHAGQKAGASLESGLGFRIGRAHRALRCAWEERIADLGLSPPQAVMLRAICEHPGSGLRELARRMRTDPMNAKRLADHLERARLVASTVDPSHRPRRDLRPTEDGLVLGAQLSARAAAWNGRLSTLLGAAELDQLQQLLGRLEDALATEAERTRPRRRRGATGEHG